jgi:exodeoxyribonuclease VII large subunit
MQALSVSQLNRKIKNLLEQDVGEILVEGEISNLSKPVSGHYYFTMKDNSAQIKCVFFKNRHLKIHATLQNGQQIIAGGRLSIYEARGDYQLIVECLSENGLGDLHKIFELLKEKLNLQGLFAEGRKKKIPKFPNCIGVISSSTGAAIKDVLATLNRRYPHALVLIIPSEVQGKDAAPQLINAIIAANKDMRSDVLILARGGGSIEDLWAFNDEKLAHAIANSKIPIVTGVGHEIDFTIADFVADLRCATPTAAAEAVTPDGLELLAYCEILKKNITKSIGMMLEKQKVLLKFKIDKISSLKYLTVRHWQRLDYLDVNLYNYIDVLIMQKQRKLQLLVSRLEVNNPKVLLMHTKSRLLQLEDKILQALLKKLQDKKQAFQSLLATLNAVSPLATLDRGYAIVTTKDTLVTKCIDVAVGSLVDIRLMDGQITCEVLFNDKYK